jgi:hypothetical protein
MIVMRPERTAQILYDSETVLRLVSRELGELQITRDTRPPDMAPRTAIIEPPSGPKAA